MSKKASRRHSSRHPAPKSSRLGLWVLVALLVLVAAVLYIQFAPGPQAPQGATISAQEAFEKSNQGAFLLDVRTQEEWDEFHVPGTTLIPLDELPDRLAEVPEDREIVVICRSGNRSQEGRDILVDAGFTQVSSMSGGLKEWGSLGYPLE
jgi:rhodanese-related sulfurtransferase